MNNLEGVSPFPAQSMDFRQLVETTAPRGSSGGPMGVLDDRAAVFSAGASHMPGGRSQKIAMMETLTIRQNDPTGRSFTANGDYNCTRREVTALLYIQEDEDYVRPTPYALDLALELLENTNAELLSQGRTFPRGTSSASESGGIYIFWERIGMTIQVEVPFRDGGLYYIHTIASDVSVMRRDVSAKTLADTLADRNPSISRRPGTTNAPASAAA